MIINCGNIIFLSSHILSSYQDGRQLSGIIYMHRISDIRMSGIALENFRLFRKICGDAAMQNVIIATVMWDAVSDAVGLRRQIELTTNPLFFKEALDRGARMVRHENTQESAKRILQQLLGNTPAPLQMQRQMVDEHIALPDTSAGIDLRARLEDQTQRHRHEIDILRQEIEGMKELHRREMERIRAEYEGFRDEMVASHRAKLEEVQAAHTTLLFRLQNSESQRNTLLGQAHTYQQTLAGLYEKLRERDAVIEELKHPPLPLRGAPIRTLWEKVTKRWGASRPGMRDRQVRIEFSREKCKLRKCSRSNFNSAYATPEAPDKRPVKKCFPASIHEGMDS